MSQIYHKDFNLDNTDLVLWESFRTDSKTVDGSILYTRPYFGLFREVFPCEMIAVPNEQKAEAAIMLSWTPGTRQQVTVEVIKFVKPGKERLDDSLSGLLSLLNNYGCDHGVIMNFERAIIFSKVKNKENKQQLEELKEIELTRAGYTELGRYWCSLKPQFVLDYEKRFNSGTQTQEDLEHPLRAPVKNADKETAPVNRRQSTKKNIS